MPIPDQIHETRLGTIDSMAGAKSKASSVRPGEEGRGLPVFRVSSCVVSLGVGVRYQKLLGFQVPAPILRWYMVRIAD